MKAIEMPVGTYVFRYNDRNRRGTVLGNKMRDGDEVVALEWDDGSVSKENVNDLIIQGSQMEENFEEIRSKMQEALKLIREAREIAEDCTDYLSDEDYQVLQDLSEEVSMLEDEGWYNSSVGC